MSLEYLTLYTVQHSSVLEILDDKGIYVPDGRRACFKSDKYFSHGYLWLRRQMAMRINHDPNKWPVWSYVSSPIKGRNSVYPVLTRGEVLMKLLVHPSRVLCFDDTLWSGYVLNYSYIGWNLKEDDEFRARWNNIVKGQRDPLEYPEEYRQEVEGSWPRMFDLVELNKRTRGRSSWRGAICGVFSEIRQSDLTEHLVID